MPSTDPPSTTAQAVQNGKRYRRVILGIFTVGIVSFLLGMALDQYLPGLVVYTVAVLAGVGLTVHGHTSGSVLLQDERDREIGRQASDITFRLFGYLGLFSFIALFFLDATGRYALSGTVEILLYAYASVSLTWGVVYLGLRYLR